MWGQALLTGDVDTFVQRLGILTHHYEALPFTTTSGETIDNLVKLVEMALIYRKTPEKFQVKSPITGQWLDHALVLSIRTFLDGLLFYHKPRNTSLHEANPASDLGAQNAHRTARYVGHQDALATPYQHVFLGSQAELTSWLSPLLEELKQGQYPYFINLSSVNHTIGLSGMSDGGYLLCDANFLQEQIQPAQITMTNLAQVIDRLWQCFSNMKSKGIPKAYPLEIEMSVYCAPDMAIKRLAAIDSGQNTNTKMRIVDDLKRYSTAMEGIMDPEALSALKQLQARIEDTEKLTDIRVQLDTAMGLSSPYSHDARIQIDSFIQRQINLIDAQVLPKANQGYEALIGQAIQQHPNVMGYLLNSVAELADIEVLNVLLQENPGLKEQLAKGHVPVQAQRALYDAFQDKQYALAYALLSHSFPASLLPSSLAVLGYNQVHYAILKSDLFALKMLLHFDPSLAEGKDSDGETPLYFAVERGLVEVIKILLKAGAKVDQVNAHGGTALSLARSMDDPAIIELLQSALTSE